MNNGIRKAKFEARNSGITVVPIISTAWVDWL